MRFATLPPLRCLLDHPFQHQNPDVLGHKKKEKPSANPLLDFLLRRFHCVMIPYHPIQKKQPFNPTDPEKRPRA